MGERITRDAAAVGTVRSVVLEVGLRAAELDPTRMAEIIRAANSDDGIGLLPDHVLSIPAGEDVVTRMAIVMVIAAMDAELFGMSAAAHVQKDTVAATLRALPRRARVHSLQQQFQLSWDELEGLADLAGTMPGAFDHDLKASKRAAADHFIALGASLMKRHRPVCERVVKALETLTGVALSARDVAECTIDQLATLLSFGLKSVPQQDASSTSTADRALEEQEGSPSSEGTGAPTQAAGSVQQDPPFDAVLPFEETGEELEESLPIPEPIPIAWPMSPQDVLRVFLGSSECVMGPPSPGQLFEMRAGYSLVREARVGECGSPIIELDPHEQAKHLAVDDVVRIIPALEQGIASGPFG